MDHQGRPLKIFTEPWGTFKYSHPNCKTWILRPVFTRTLKHDSGWWEGSVPAVRDLFSTFTFHLPWILCSASQCKKKKKNTLNGGISMVSYIRFSFECVWTPPFIQGHPQLGATESELEVIPSPSSRPFPQSCLPTQMPPSCSLFPQLPRSSLLCISSLISCAANPQPSPHLPQLSRQVAQEKIAMGKDS